MAEILTNDELPGQFGELYDSVLNLLGGVDSIHVLSGSNIFTVKCVGINLFDGYLPSRETLKRVRDANTAPPDYLLHGMKIVSQDGGEVSGYEADHVVDPYSYTVWSTEIAKAKNVNILQTSTTNEESGFVVTNVFVRNPTSGFTCPVKQVLVWVLDTKPELGDYDKYNDFSRDQFDADTSPTKPVAFIENVPQTGSIDVPLNKWVKGKYVLVKLIDSHRSTPDSESNIDVEFIGFGGFTSHPEGLQERQLHNGGTWLGLGTPSASFNSLI